MSYKFKFFAQPIVTDIKSIVEVAFIEFSVGVVCAVFAHANQASGTQLRGQVHL